MIRSAQLVRAAVLGLALSSLMVLGAAAANVGVGTVNTSALRLREGAGTDTTILATASKGETVVVLEDAGNGWYKVDYQTIEGYMSGEYLDVSTTADVTIGYGKVTTGGSVLNVRSGPGTSYGRTATLSDGTIVSIVGVDSGWYKIEWNGKTGYVSSDYMITTKESPSSRGDSTATAYSSDLGAQIVAYAKEFLGCPYSWGATGPNAFDCSGFTYYVYKHFGYTLNRGATGQLSNGSSVASMYDLVPGDLVFFYDGKVSTPVSHVGIYIGDGQFIHASTGDGRDVQIDDLFTGHYAKKYVYGRHII